MNRERVYEKAIEKYGKELQFIVAIEELSELQKELTKALRGIGNKNNITEELADVEIMLEQIKIMLEIKAKDVEYAKDFKVKRLSERLNMQEDGSKLAETKKEGKECNK